MSFDAAPRLPARGRRGLTAGLTAAGFAIVLAGVLAVTSVTEQSLRRTAQHNAVDDAELIATLGFAAALSDGRLTAHDTRVARSQIAAARASHEILGVVVWSPGGRILFADPPAFALGRDGGGVSPRVRRVLETGRAQTGTGTELAGISIPSSFDVVLRIRRDTPVAAEFAFSRAAVDREIASARQRLHLIAGVGGALIFLAMLPLLRMLARRLPAVYERRHASRGRELSRALQRSEFRLEYQPIVALGSDRVASVEALLRWEHPKRGRIPPDEFIPVAEAAGVIEDLGAWVLEQACSDAARWHARAPLSPPLVVAVNLSALQITPRLAGQVERTLAASGLAPGLLRLEVTESALMRDVSGAISALQELGDLGVSLAVDDFGTGYSSLAYLQRLPLDEVKIDRSFVAALDDEGPESAIVGAVVSLAHALDLHVTAEGVETAGQLQVLRRLGCDSGQGYFFARPQAAAAMDDLLGDAANGGRLPRATGPGAATPDRHMPTVLIAEDHEDVVRLASVSLGTAGFHVTSTGRGVEAVRMAARLHPDCVLLDVGLPDLSGIAVCRALRRDPATRDCVILMVTGRAAARDKIEAFEAGADDYIVKPFSPRELVDRIRAALRQHDAAVRPGSVSLG